MKVSLLMRDSSEKDGNIETMLDYILSWTLRRASDIYSTEKPILYQYCRRILFKLLDIENNEHIKIKSVETWKQWNRIDLHANIELDENGIIKRHAILIENKAYTPVHDNQLNRYKQIFEETYDHSQWQLHYVLITCLDEIPETMKEECRNAGFKYYPLLDVFSNKQEESESDLFNEFWLRQW